MNGVLGALRYEDEVDLRLLFAAEFLENGKLPGNSPLAAFPFSTFPGTERTRERIWKLLGRPNISPRLIEGSDWIYSPVETRLPTKKVPVAFTLHDLHPFEESLPWSKTEGHRRNRKRWEWWLPKALLEARLVFTVSEFSKRRMVDLLRVPAEKIAISGNGVDSIYFEQKSGPACMDPPYTLLVGGLRPEKGGGDTLEVARQLKNDLPEFEFRVVGQPNDPALVAKAIELGNFRFLGKVPDAELPALYRDAVCLLFLSLYEGFGMPPLEAMACGTPVLCSDQASLPEIVGEAAATFPPGSSSEVAERIKTLITDPTLRTEMAALGRQYASAFTWAAVADRVVVALRAHS